jgi:hypothetical protein
MRVCSAIFFAVSLLTSSVLLGQGSTQGLSVTNYQFVSEQFYSTTHSYVTYRADLLNTGQALNSVTATLTSLDPVSFQVVPGQDTLHFGPVPANTQVTGAGTFTILVDRLVHFDPNFAALKWAFQITQPAPPIANAGPNQMGIVGKLVTLNGSGSSNPSGIGTLSFSWAFTARPPGSAATLTNPNSVMPNFVPDVAGTYLITLTVNNGVASGSASTTVSTTQQPPPVANAGSPQTVKLGSTVVLDGSKSTSGSGNPLTYSWTLTMAPTGSAATLTGPNTVSPTFAADKSGNYVAQLIVNDGIANSAPSTVTISTQVVRPVANAGSAQVVNVNSTVQLNGSGSTDANGLPLTYQWSFASIPQGSAVTLNNPAGVNPAFTVDRPGNYLVQLMVNNGTLSSDPATVLITTNPVAAPTANAGPNQTVQRGSTVQLNGSGTDPQGFPLTFQWSILNKPADSSSSLSSSVIANPTFVADRIGNYVEQLIVSNGLLGSLPATVTISTTCAPPTANAGPNQNVVTGATVTLDGSGSGDVCQDPLSYSWSFTARPNGSTATLSNSNTVSPSFVADLPGTYVAQLIVDNGLTKSNPATVTIGAASPGTIILAPNPLTFSSNTTGTLTLVLPAPAGPNGLLVTLSSTTPAVATVPANVTVAAGATSAAVTVTPGNTPGSTAVLATGDSFVPGGAVVNVVAPGITVALNSNTVGLAQTIGGTITLNATAPAGGVVVSLTAAPGGVVDVQPLSVTMAAGSTSASFTVKGLSLGLATITVSAPGYASGTANVSVQPVGKIILPANVTVGTNQSVGYPVTLSAPAPAGGVTIVLTSSDITAANVMPASIFVAEGATAPATPPQLNGINFGSVTISASATGFTGDSEPAQVVATLSFVPGTLTVPLNGIQNLTLNLSAPAPASGLTVNLSSDNSGVATVPASVTIPANAKSATVPVTGAALGSAIVHATSAASATDTTALVLVSNFGQIILPQNATVGLGQSAAFPVTLTTPAPAGGVTITLSSADPTKVTITPASVTIAAGATTPATQPQIKGLNLGTANVTASGPGFTPATQAVEVIATLTFVPGTVTMTGVNTQSIALNLSAPAPAGGLTITLSSDNPSVVTVPSTAIIAANATSVMVPVTGVAEGSATIHANALPNVADATASIIVKSAGKIILPNVTSVQVGQFVPFPVTLPAPAPPGGVTVMLSSSDSSKATVTPDRVNILAGQTTPATQPQINGIGFGSATISASAPAYTAASQAVQVNVALAFTPNALTITGSTTQNLTLTVSNPSPNALIVSLSSSNPAVATVPSTVTIPANGTTVLVPVTSIAAGSATITASANAANVASATANVTVLSGIILPANPMVLAVDSVTFPVSLASPAPPGGVIVTLVSSDPSKVMLSTPNILILEGQTTSTRAKLIGIAVGSATITATAFGYSPTTTTVQVTSGVLTFVPATITINGTATQNLTLALTPPPAISVTINLTSSDPTVATVLATITVPANASSVSVPVTPVGNGSTVIDASGTNLVDTTAKVNVIITPQMAQIVR